MKISDLYITYLISQEGQSTSTKLSKILNKNISHDKITRFLNKEFLDEHDLWQRVNKNNILTSTQAESFDLTGQDLGKVNIEITTAEVTVALTSCKATIDNDGNILILLSSGYAGGPKKFNLKITHTDTKKDTAAPQPIDRKISIEST